jgi:hypothetical protein
MSRLNNLLWEGKVFPNKDIDVRRVLVSHDFSPSYNRVPKQKIAGFSSTWMACLAENLQTAKPYQMNGPVL